MTLLDECKITINRDLRNVLVLLWARQAVKITMEDVVEKGIHTLDKWEAVSKLVCFQDNKTLIREAHIFDYSNFLDVEN